MIVKMYWDWMCIVPSYPGFMPSLPKSDCTASNSFFFNDTAPTEIYPLSLHDALPILLTALDSTIRTRRPVSRPIATERGPCCDCAGCFSNLLVNQKFEPEPGEDST